MNIRTFAVGLGITFLFTVAISAQTPSLRNGAVYVMTNQTTNAVMAFARDTKTGKLTLVDTEPTGGAGNPIPIDPDPPVDPLASSGALVIDPSNPNVVYAVNAGSHDISVLAVEPNGLKLVQKISSGGTRPISLAIYRKWLYVLNDGDRPSITGYTITFGGTLQMIDGSVRFLTASIPVDPAQIGFNNDGTMLVVSDKMNNQLHMFPVDDRGITAVPTASPSYGLTPFAFTFGPRGQLFVVEAFSGFPNGGAVTSYDASSPLMLDPISGSIRSGGGDTCWVEMTSDGQYLMVSNPTSGTISTYSVDRRGRLRLRNSVAASTGEGSMPVDVGLSRDDKFLYVLENGSHTVSGWLVHLDRTLSPIGEFGVIPPGAQGIAVK